jgi:hypothetical protein
MVITGSKGAEGEIVGDKVTFLVTVIFFSKYSVLVMVKNSVAVTVS